MARLWVVDSSDEHDSDDSFPDLGTLLNRKKQPPRGTSKRRDQPEESGNEAKEPTKAPGTVRRRKLAPISDNTLLRQWTPDVTTESADAPEERKKRRPRVALRSRTSLSAPTITRDDGKGGHDEFDEGETIIEEVSLAEDVFETAESDISEFEDALDDFIVDDDESLEEIEQKPPKKPSVRLKGSKTSQSKEPEITAEPTGKDAGGEEPNRPSRARETRGGRKQAANDTKVSKQAVEKDLADTFTGLRIDELPVLSHPTASKNQTSQDHTPPSTPPKPKRGLVSPKKLSRIPDTPHRPSTDLFWSQDFVDDWNDEHSPRKQLFPDPAKALPRPSSKKPAPVPAMKPTIRAREAKKNFEVKKHELAETFLRELDETITDGQLSQLSASTGGIKINWSKKLNTTAGRANWKRETIRNARPDGPPPKHFASIELAEKVIDDENRLLNVVAHEFCHLANFMISGIVKNPHGREFKIWAAKTSRAFADRGVDVTTKHSYDIDFKYVWECEECHLEYKRHSKSINPERHRCGKCKAMLVQIKPTPRGSGGTKAGCGEKKGPTEYQLFMKEEMKRTREENPGSPQKDIMKLVANKWSQRRGKTETPTVKAVEVIDLVED